MRDLTSAVQAELDKQKVRVVVFIEAWFATGPLRMWTGRGTTEWNGQTWSGPSAGQPATLQISAMGESGVVEATGIQALLTGGNVLLPGTSQTLLQAIQEELRQGKEGTIWVGFRDSSNAIIADPAIAFKGRLDAAACQVAGEGVTLTVNFESRMIDLQRALGFGLGVDGLEIDDEAFRIAANICDEAVALKAGGTEPRYTMNGVFDTTARPGQVLEGAREAMAGWLPYMGGKWRPMAGAWRAPAVDFDESDFLGPITFQALESRRDKFNAVRGKFIDPVTWKETDYPPYAHAELVTRDGDTLWESLEQPLCVSAAECQRKGKVAVLRARGREVSMRLGRRGWRLTPGATFRVSFAALGWVNKTFRCGPLGLAFEEDEEGYYVMGVNVSAIEESPEVYAWDAATEEGSLATPAAVTLPSASPSVLVSPGGDPTVRPGVLGVMTYRPTTNPLTATDAGATATVNVAAFTQRIQGFADKSINSGSVTGLSFSMLYFIYYDDAGFAGGAVTYAAATTKETAINGAGRFFVGSILTPADGGADTVGFNDGGVGAQTGGHISRKPTTAATVGTVTGAGNANDGDWSTKLTARMPVPSANNNITSAVTSVKLSGFGLPDDFGRFYKNMKLLVKANASVQNELDATGTSTLRVRTSVNGGASWTDFRTATAVGADASATLALQTDTIPFADGTDPNQVQIEVRAEGHTGGTTNEGALDS